MAAEVRQHLVKGDYDSIADGEESTDTITEYLRSISHDLDLRLFYCPSRPLTDKTPTEKLGQLRRMNFGFGKIDRLEGSVARLAVHGFVHLDEGVRSEIREGVGAVMSQVADADALLLDLRKKAAAIQQQ